MTNTIKYYKIGETVFVNFVLPIFDEPTKVRTKARIITINMHTNKLRVKLIEDEILIKGKLYKIRQDDDFRLDVEPSHLRKLYEPSTQSYSELKTEYKFTQ